MTGSVSSHMPSVSAFTAEPPRARRPASLVAYPGWRETRDDILLLVSAGRARVALIGGPGTGKTWMLNEIARVLEQTGQPALRTPDPTVEASCRLIDDADQLDDAALDALAGTSGSLILTGLPAASHRLRPQVRLLMTLSPLNAGEVARFVSARLADLGRSPDLLRSDALTALATRSGGNPKRLQALLTAALFLASTDSAPQIEPEYIDRAADFEDGLADHDRQMGIAAPSPNPAPAAPAPPPAVPAAPTHTPWLPRQRAAQTAPPLSRTQRGAMLVAASTALGLGLLYWSMQPSPTTSYAVTNPPPSVPDATTADPVPLRAASPVPAPEPVHAPPHRPAISAHPSPASGSATPSALLPTPPLQPPAQLGQVSPPAAIPAPNRSPAPLPEKMPRSEAAVPEHARLPTTSPAPAPLQVPARLRLPAPARELAPARRSAPTFRPEEWDARQAETPPVWRLGPTPPRTVSPGEISRDHPKPYIGTFTTGPDGVRVFRPGP